MKTKENRYDRKYKKLTNEECLDRFIEELQLLCDKYEVNIGGCGCCDSPSADIDGSREGNYATIGNINIYHKNNTYKRQSTYDKCY